MIIPVQIVFKNTSRSEALAGWIRESALKLEVFDGRITSCRVSIEELEGHRERGREFRVKVEVRGARIHAESTLHDDKDVYAALREAFGSVRRQLNERKSAELAARKPRS